MNNKAKKYIKNIVKNHEEAKRVVKMLQQIDNNDANMDVKII